MIAEYNDAGKLARRYVYGAGIDQPILWSSFFWVGDYSYRSDEYYHRDALGSVIATSGSETGRLAQTHTYSPYGLPDEFGVVAGGNPYLYTGREYDSETGLYYYRNRYYDPQRGRFLQPDPIGYQAGMNLYAYVDGNPITWADPLGLDKMFEGGNSYIASRALGGESEWLSHNFIVTGADHIGDPNATVFSYGNNALGYVGRVDESTTGFSEGTYAADRATWEGLKGGSPDNNPNLVRIPASPATVRSAVDALIENQDYSAISGPFGANSSSAAQAIGNRAAGFPLDVPGWPSRIAPGAWSWREIQFRGGR